MIFSFLILLEIENSRNTVTKIIIISLNGYNVLITAIYKIEYRIDLYVRC